jgi:hypothetical protein
MLSPECDPPYWTLILLQCTTLVKAYLPVLIQEFLNSETPDKLCTFLRLC